MKPGPSSTLTSFDSLTLACVAEALQPLCGGRIDKIAQPVAHELVLSVWQAGHGQSRLLIDCSTQWSRCHLLTERNAKTAGIAPQVQPPPFCMTLRKYLEGGRIVSIAQRGFDRLLDLTISGLGDAQLVLTAELMGRNANILLLGPDGHILQAARLITRQADRVREVLPGSAYRPPPATGRPDPRGISRHDFEAWLAEDEEASATDPAAWLRGRFEGISPLLAREIAARSAIGSLWQAFDTIFAAAREGNWQPVELLDGDSIIGAYPLPLQAPGGLRPAANIHSALENYYREAMARAAFAARRQSLLGGLGKAAAIKRHTLGQVRQGTSERPAAARYRHWGELLVSHPRQPRGPMQAEVIDYSLDPPAPVVVPLEPTRNSQENAQRYFARAKQVEANAANLAALEERLSGELTQLEDAITGVEAAATIAEIGAWHERALAGGWLRELPAGGAKAGPQRGEFDGKRIRRHTSPDGYTVLVGENALANDHLVRQVAQPNDWWLHVRAGTSAHVVVATQNAPQQVPATTLAFAAGLAAAHSPGKHAGLVAVDYTLRKYVRRPRKAAPGLVTYTHEKTLDVAPSMGL